MDKKFFKVFWNKRSGWTFGLCLMGVLVIGSIVAVDKIQQEEKSQPETVMEQAYLEEEDYDELDPEDVNDTLLSDLDEESPVIDDEIDRSVSADGTAAGGSGNMISEEADASDVETAGTDSGSMNGTDAAAFSEDPASYTAEAASTNVISETDLLAANVAFDTETTTLLWPAAGTILIDYSMDGSVYFPTLNQYQYNPALIIGSETGNQVISSARGIVETVKTDEVTGLTMTVNIGNGYRLTYGQLKEAAVQEGDLVEAGEVLGYVSEPTRYYVKEGSNLFFEMTKDGEPVDPVLYLE